MGFDLGLGHRKTCIECGARQPLDRVFCLRCQRTLEGHIWLVWVLWTSAIALVYQTAIYVSCCPDLSFVAECFMNEALLILLGYPLWKLIQKVRHPARPLLREISSVFSDRSDRIVILALASFLIFTSPVLIVYLQKGLPKLTELGPAWQHLLARARILAFLTLVPLGILVVVAKQGLGFFNLRRANPMKVAGRVVGQPLVDNEPVHGALHWMVRADGADVDVVGFVRSDQSGVLVLGGPSGTHLSGHGEGWQSPWEALVKLGYVPESDGRMSGLLPDDWLPPPLTRKELRLLEGYCASADLV